jgi:WD40 repeat protein
MVFALVSGDSEKPVDTQPVHVIYGHDNSVTCIAVSAELDLVVSGSDDGTVMLHSLRSGRYIRSIVNANCSRTDRDREPAGCDAVRMKVTWVGLTESSVVTYSAEENCLCTFSSNGRWLASAEISEVLHALLLSQDGNVLLTGGTDCRVRLRWVCYER